MGLRGSAAAGGAVPAHYTWANASPVEEPSSSMMPHITDTRVIDADAPQYNTTLIRRVDQTDELGYFWVRYDAEPIHFEPGQY
ncbi:MAG TPA: hypothetical protein VIV06_04035, partial [Candidatus Limnocylindrales bacterium]